MGLYDFPRTARLLSSGEFRRVFEQTDFRAPHPFFLLLATQASSQNSARLGLVVAKKNVRRAVDRNRVKRLIRESFRQHRPELPNLDIVVLVRKEAAQAENGQLLMALDKLWSRLIRQAAEAASKSETPA